MFGYFVPIGVMFWVEGKARVRFFSEAHRIYWISIFHTPDMPDTLPQCFGEGFWERDYSLLEG